MNYRDLSHSHRIALLVALLLVGLVGLMFVDPIPQDPAYHVFADQRPFLGIPNFNDVMSNTGFAVVGILGMFAVMGSRQSRIFAQVISARPYVIFFAGVALVSLGSGYYHWAPDNGRLLWDRLPMSAAFMAFAAAVIADRVHANAGNGWLLVVMIALGLWSLVYWHQGELQGRGDLRFYAFVQFFPVIALPFILKLFPNYRYVPGRYIAWVVVWYGLSKVLEHFDTEVFDLLGHWVSGHTLKHLAAAMSAFVVFRMLVSQADPVAAARIHPMKQGGGTP